MGQPLRVSGQPQREAANTGAARRMLSAADFGKVALSFEANQGQASEQVKFLARGQGYSLFLGKKGAVLAVSQPAGRAGAAENEAETKTAGAGRAASRVFPLDLADANPAAAVVAEDALPGTANYFVGSDRSRWRTGVPTYSRVRYRSVYPGVDLVYYGNQNQLEYDFVVSPHGDPSVIRLQFGGAEGVRLAANGDLILRGDPSGAARGLGESEIAFRKPVVYQMAGGRRVPVEGSFQLLAGNRVGFRLGAYDHGRQLVIDPILAYSTFLGGAANAQADGGGAAQIAVDAAGDAYIVGTTTVADFPTTTGAYQSVLSGTEFIDNGTYSFVAKLNPAGNKLLYSTYLGGTGTASQPGDQINSIFLDAAGDAYLTGLVTASDFPVTANAFQPQLGSYQNCFLTKLGPSGAKLVYSTYVGGYNGEDTCTQVVANKAGNAYLVGTVNGTDFPTTAGAFQTTNPSGKSAIVAEFNTTGTALVYSTFLGGNEGTTGNALAIDSSGNAYVTGSTFATNFPKASAGFENFNEAEVSRGEATAYVAKLNATGTAVVYATYLGGSGGNTYTGEESEIPSGIAVDSSGNIYVAGVTVSQDFPLLYPIQSKNKTYNNTSQAGTERFANGFVTKLNSSLKKLVFSTYIGSSQGEVAASGASALALDASGNAYIVGTTYGIDFPTTSGAFQPTNQGYSASQDYDVTNAYLAELSSTGKLLYSTYLGGSGTNDNNDDYYFAGDYGSSLALDPSGNVYVAGIAQSPNFPTTAGALQTVKTAQSAAFVAKFNLTATGKTTLTTLASDANPQTPGSQVTFTAFVQPLAGKGIPTGTVKFSISSGSSATVALDDTGHASYTPASITDGVHQVTAAYSGSGSYSASSDSLSEVVAGAPNTVTAVSGGNQSSTLQTPYRNPLVVVVKDADGVPVPNIPVYFGGDGLDYVSISGNYQTLTDYTGHASLPAVPITAGSLIGKATVSGVVTPAFFPLTAALPVAPAPIFTPAPGQYASAQTVILSSPLAYATIYYTTDGSTPTTNSSVFNSNFPILISGKETIKAIVVSDQYVNSPVTSGAYSLSTQPPSYPQGIIESIGGTRYSGGKPYGTPFLGASIDPSQIFYDSSGNLYVVGYFTQDVRKVNAKTQEITLFAGHCVLNSSNACEGGYSGDGGAATSAMLNGPQYGTVDAQGNVYIADTGNNLVRMVNAKTGKISTVAGHCVLVKGACQGGYSGDKGLATKALLASPSGVAVDAAGDIYIADNAYGVIRKVTKSTGIITTIAGTGHDGHTGDNGPATKAELFWPTHIALDPEGNLYISESGNNDVRRVDAKTQIITTFAGNCVPKNGGCEPNYTGNGGLATEAQFNNPSDIIFDKAGNVYIADAFNNVIRQVNIKTGIVSAVVGDAQGAGPEGTFLDGGYGGDGGEAIDATFNNPFSIAFNSAGDMLVADFYNGLVREVTPILGGLTATPVFSVTGGTYASRQSVSIECATTYSTIYYTTDGTTPTTSSNQYYGSIEVESSETVKAIAVSNGLGNSPVATVTYTIQ
jgi:sugar lactone lactonase YvrE